MSKVNNKVFAIPRPIIYTGKLLQVISPKLATNFALKLFQTPYKFKAPDREKTMFQRAHKEKLYIPVLDKRIQIYHCDQHPEKVLIVHGWAGRGTQLHSIAKTCVDHDIQAISFDAPAHGYSEGKVSNMTEFISCIHEIDKQYGPFTYAIGHSLGGMALMNAVKEGFNIKKLVVIGSGNSITTICDNFVKRLELKPKIGGLLKDRLDELLGSDSENLSTYKVAENVKIPVLIVHDTQDTEVDIKEAHQIDTVLDQSELLITTGLGHHKILWKPEVLNKIIHFLKS